MSKPAKPRLGRGLGALLGEVTASSAADTRIRTVPIARIRPNPFQPRRTFPPEELEELQGSIRENGLLQPPVVRPDPEDPQSGFQLVAGERRFRSVEALGWTELPVIVRDVDDRTLLVLALVENIQRESLDPLEEAEGYRVLMDEFGLTQAAVAEAVGRNRATVANTLRLLKLPPSVQQHLRTGTLSMGHARALLGVDDVGRLIHLANQVVNEGWTVRDVERRVRTVSEADTDSSSPSARSVDATPSALPPPSRAGDPGYQPLRQALEERLGTRVTLQAPGGEGKRGTILIPFTDADELERLFQIITGKTASEIVS
jgi:ParB family transcriptional regulator, chromosome partitioning protein